jgi:hypothetical protein
VEKCVAVAYLQPGYNPGRKGNSSSLAVFDPDKWVTKSWYCVAPNQRVVVYSGAQATIWVHFGSNIVPSAFEDSMYDYVHPFEPATIDRLGGSSRWPVKYSSGSKSFTIRNEDDAIRAGLEKRRFFKLNSNIEFTIR